MATPPGDRSVLPDEADARELDPPSPDRGLLDANGGLESRDQDNVGALEEETRRRLEVESTLRDSEARYRLLYDNNPTMYFTLSPEGIVVSVNQFGATQLGYQPDELIGQSVLKVFKPKEHAAVLEQLTTCAASPMKVFQWEIQKVRKDGSTLWVKERAQSVRDHKGQILSLVVCEDITERRLTEDYMRESEERWRALFEHAGAGMAQLDLNGRFLRVNPRLCEMLGYSSKTLLRRTFQEFTHPDDLEPNLRLLDELVAGKRPSFSMEKRYQRSDDVWVWVDLTVSLVRNACTAPAYFIAVVQNIGDRKRAEDALQKSEARFRQIAETIEEVVWSADPSIGKTLYISPAYERVWGRTCASLYEDPNSFVDSIHADDRGTVLGALGEHRDGIPFDQEYRIIRPDGAVRWIWDRGFPVRDPGTGQLTHYVGVALDITERRQAEEALRLSESAIRELHEITSTKAVPFEQQIRELLDLGRRRFQLPIAAFSTLKGERLELTAIRSDKPMASEGTLLPQCSICSETVKINGTIAIEHLSNSQWKDGSACFLLGFESYLGTGLVVGGQKVGAICFMDYEPYRTRFSEADKDFLLLMARWITREVERRNAELVLQNQKEALRRSEMAVRQAFEERERLSQDLHDNLLQSLYAVGMGLELTKQRIQRVSRTNAKRLEQSVGQLNHVIREVRTFISHVEPTVVLDQTVADLLRALAGSFTATGAGEIVVALDDEAGLELSTEQRTHVLAIAKEALSNSIRHTKAEKRTLSLHRHGNKIRLEISDDGRGFSPAQRRKQGMGLHNMRARARKLRGRIAITSVLRQGTTVTLTIPSPKN